MAAHLIDQDPMQLAIPLAMKQIIVVDHLAVDLPLLFEER